MDASLIFGIDALPADELLLLGALHLSFDPAGVLVLVSPLKSHATVGCNNASLYAWCNVQSQADSRGRTYSKTSTAIAETILSKSNAQQVKEQQYVKLDSKTYSSLYDCHSPSGATPPGSNSATGIDGGSVCTFFFFPTIAIIDSTYLESRLDCYRWFVHAQILSACTLKLKTPAFAFFLFASSAITAPWLCAICLRAVIHPSMYACRFQPVGFPILSTIAFSCCCCLFFGLLFGRFGRS